MNNYIKKIIAAVSCTVETIFCVLALFFFAPKIPVLPETSGEISYHYSEKTADGQIISSSLNFEIGKDISAIRISDAGKSGKITKVNYVPNRFLKPGTFSSDMQVVDLTKPFEFAEKGTLIVVVMNLDPMAEDFAQQAEKLSPYKMGEYWCYTLSLPKIFSASNVYSGTDLVARHGKIENYDFIDYTTSYTEKTEEFSAETERTSVNMKFYTRRQAMNPYQMVTIHYQSAHTAYAGITDCPLFGTESAVTGIVKNSRDLLIAFTLFAFVVSAVLIVLSILERSKEFIPAIVQTFGITVLLASRYFLSETTFMPLVCVSISLSASFIVLLGALISIGRNFGKFPATIVFAGIAVSGALLAFLCPFLSYSAAHAVRTAYLCLKGISAAGLWLFIGLAVFDKKDKSDALQAVCVCIVGVSAVFSLFLPQIFPAAYNPMFWACAAIPIAAFIRVFVVFAEMKKSNVYLTANLSKEVERQTKDIKAVITERDNLLQFVAHDMKKPLVSSVSLLETAIEREKDTELVKALKIIHRNNARVVNNLSEIGTYARFNYIAEPSQVTDLSEICETLCRFHTFDCNANGIILKNLIGNPCKVFVKRQALENAVSNLIMNAVEHADCFTITLSAKSDKDATVFCVADDGKGITDDVNAFDPHVSEKKEGGMGLFICKNIIESMNGKLTYESDENGTSFYISLLKA